MVPVIVVGVVEVFVVVVVTKKCNPDEQKCKVEILYILKLFSLLIFNLHQKLQSLQRHMLRFPIVLLYFLWRVDLCLNYPIFYIQC